MALSRFILPFADVGSGIKPSSGAELFFYETGTNVLQDTFNCPDGTTPNSNPVVSDSSGLFPDIFTAGTYKVVLKDKNGSQRWEADPVFSAPSGDLQSFASVAEMAAAKLKSGDMASTASYYAGIFPQPDVLQGGASYNILTDAEFGAAPDGLCDIQLTGGLVAVLLVTDSNYHTDQCGVGSDGLAALQSLNDKLETIGGTIVLDRTITITNTIKFSKNVSVISNNYHQAGFICDYTNWNGLGLHSVPVNTGVYIESGTDTARGAKYGRLYSNFFVTGINNGAIFTQGVYVGVSDRRTIPDDESSLGYSVRAAAFNNLEITQFDVGITLGELWGSSFDNTRAAAVRIGLDVNGQSVNNTFTKCEFNCASYEAYTTASAGNAECVHIDGYSNYGPTENKTGQPEGLTFSQCQLFFGNKGAFVGKSLHVTFGQCIIDLCFDYALQVGPTRNFEVDQCWLASDGGDLLTPTIDFIDGAGDVSITCSITNTELRRIPTAGNANAGMRAALSTTHDGITYEANTHKAYEGDEICSFFGSSTLLILNNRFKSNVDDILTQQCIFVEGGDIVNIDGNVSNQSNKILRLSTTPATNLYVGNNSSTSQLTKETGIATILAGTSSVTVAQKHTDTSLGAAGSSRLLAVVTANIDKEEGPLYVSPNGLNGNVTTYTITAAAAVDTLVYWQSRCISAF